MKVIDMKSKLIYAAAALLMLCCSCGKHEEVFFDTPFVSISDITKLTTSMIVDKDGNNVLTELCVSLNASSNWLKGPVKIEYELIVGDGLKEGVDFKVQPSTMSPLEFELGTTDLPVRILWYRNAAFDPSKDNTLEVRLTSSSMEGMLLGYPGTNSIRKSFIFTKQ